MNTSGSSILRDKPLRESPPLPGAPRDPVFERWAADGLVWLPERGMGRLHVHEAPYDAAYWEKYVGYAATEQGHKITAARVDLVRRFTDRHVVDIGIGCGAFIEARKGWTWGYDINPVAIEWLNGQNRWCDPYTQPNGVEAVSLWDTLEHIPDPAALLRNVRTWVFVSLPIVPGSGPPPLDWKHLRRDEHVFYWTHAGFIAWMDAHGFDLVEANQDEVGLGRSNIETFVMKRRAR